MPQIQRIDNLFAHDFSKWFAPHILKNVAEQVVARIAIAVFASWLKVSACGGHTLKYLLARLRRGEVGQILIRLVVDNIHQTAAVLQQLVNGNPLCIRNLRIGKILCNRVVERQTAFGGSLQHKHRREGFRNRTNAVLRLCCGGNLILDIGPTQRTLVNGLSILLNHNASHKMPVESVEISIEFLVGCLLAASGADDGA